MQAFGVQLLVGFVFMLLPGSVVLACLAAQAQNSAGLIVLSQVMIAAHGCADYLAMLYFITPYRRILVGWVRTALGLQAQTPGKQVDCHFH